MFPVMRGNDGIKNTKGGKIWLKNLILMPISGKMGLFI